MVVLGYLLLLLRLSHVGVAERHIGGRIPLRVHIVTAAGNLRVGSERVADALQRSSLPLLRTTGHLLPSLGRLASRLHALLFDLAHRDLLLGGLARDYGRISLVLDAD